MMSVMETHHKSNMSIIDKVKKNIKDFLSSSWIDEVFWIVLVVFVALGSFVLGARYERETFLEAHPISLSRDERIVQAWQDFIKEKKSEARYFASKNGTVYYPLACPAGKRIAEDNRVYFENEDEARSAGYKQSKRCN